MPGSYVNGTEQDWMGWDEGDEWDEWDEWMNGELARCMAASGIALQFTQSCHRFCDISRRPVVIVGSKGLWQAPLQ